MTLKQEARQLAKTNIKRTPIVRTGPDLSRREALPLVGLFFTASGLAACARPREIRSPLSREKRMMLSEELYKACELGLQTEVERLLKKGADPNDDYFIHPGRRMNTPPYFPLDIAIRKGHTSIVKLLIEGGADVASEDGQYTTPLQHAAYCDQTDIIKILLDAKAPINEGIGGTPLLIVAGRGNVEATKLLLDRKAEVEEGHYYTGLTPLMEAAKRAQFNTVKLLVEAGADVNAEDRSCKSVLQHAVPDSGPYSGEAMRVIEYLQQNGAKDSRAEETLANRRES